MQPIILEQPPYECFSVKSQLQELIKLPIGSMIRFIPRSPYKNDVETLRSKLQKQLILETIEIRQKYCNIQYNYELILNEKLKVHIILGHHSVPNATYVPPEAWYTQVILHLLRNE